MLTAFFGSCAGPAFLLLTDRVELNKPMANGIGLKEAAVFRESSVSNVKISFTEATAAFQRTAAALMAAHPADSYQKVMFSIASSGPRVATDAGESLKPALASKAGVSFVIPKNKLSGALVPVVRNVVGKWELNDAKKEEEVKLLPRRKTRWGIDLTQDPGVRRGRALALQTRAEQIAAQLESGHLDIDTNEGTRSPSPPPIYDSNGQRTNTREGRRREQLELERREAIGECLQLNPLYKPPAGYKPVYKEAKLYIPVKDYPGYNFIGLILGPRGNTQKRMEAETGSKIAIRGKGAVKEGKGGRRDGKEAEGVFEDLHVHITADSIEKVDAAVALIEPLLTPVDEDRNTHKRKQLRELAEMNGTMRDFPKACSICGETDHREWHCPKDKLYTFQAKVSCQTCGDGGHPTIDCPRKNRGQGKVLDKEYLSFLEELGDGLSGSSAGLTLAKLPAEERLEDDSHPVPSTSATTTAGLSVSHLSRVSETSLDPNQLVDVTTGPQPMLITASGPQPMPATWASVGMFPSGFEARMVPQQGSSLQVEGDRPFPNLPNGSRSPGANSLDVCRGPAYLLNSGCVPFFHGQPPPSVNVTMRGLQGSANMVSSSAGTYGLEATLSVPQPSSLGGQPSGNKEEPHSSVSFPVLASKEVSMQTGPHFPNYFPEIPLSQENPSSEVSSITPHTRDNSIPGPSLTDSQTVVPPWAFHPPSSGATNSWNQNAPSEHALAGKVPMIWESALHPQPQSWEKGPSQQTSPLWPLPSEPLRFPPTGGQQPPWEVNRRLGEVNPHLSPPFSSQSLVSTPTVAPQLAPTIHPPNPSWNPTHPPLPPNQPWRVSEPRNVLQYPPPSNFPSSGSHQQVWRGLSTPLATTPTSNRHAPTQSPQIMISPQSNQSSSEPFPPWHPPTNNHKPCIFTNFGSPGMIVSSAKPSFGPTWRQHPGVEPSRPDPHPPPPPPPLPLPLPPSNSERGGTQTQSYDLFAPSATTTNHAFNGSYTQQHQVGVPVVPASTSSGFRGMPEPNTQCGQPSVSVEFSPWHRTQSLGQNLRFTHPVLPPSAPNTGEVDAEYEKLMASVGVK